MNKLALLAAVVVGFVGLRVVSQRIATHQQVLPTVRRRINTRVVRINQN